MSYMSLMMIDEIQLSRTIRKQCHFHELVKQLSRGFET